MPATQLAAPNVPSPRPEAAAHRLTWADVSARRLERAGLAAPRGAGAADEAGTVAAMCGAHAQVLSAGELSVGLRMAGGTRDGVRDALWRRRELVKTFGPRGTVHLLPVRELPMWTGALAAVPAGGAALAKGARLTPEQTEQVVDAIGAALREAELTAEELDEAVVAATGPWAGDPVMPAFQGFWPRWRQALHLAAHRGELCFGANRGRKATYTSPRRLVPGFAPEAAAPALRALLRRYLHAYGPATPQHFATWLAAPRRWAAELFASMGEEVERVRIAESGADGWVLAGDTEPAAEAPRGLRLLPYFDAYTVAAQPRELLFPGRAAERALAGGQAGNFPVVLVDGTVSGVWHLRRSGRRCRITVEPLRALRPADERELAEQVERVGAFLGERAESAIGPISVGPHA
ncbi:winged helix DNA-binding domain-containing protein [Allonocardiopsis opalescens]|uniref:Winged helix DNA-binding protein n=1 Tax=Allonocardiopsis opalescens TaxID=1144618 RepID=A0A2T0Q5A2_9ACTN|nr:winged helix DNA-binding domain-containing protein [Allonocardiopsis opalescens]PRX98891.1 winged helix DNA-binding protein [Allonocardiopsis opalescens]